MAKKPLAERVALIFEEFFTFVSSKYGIDREKIRAICLTPPSIAKIRPPSLMSKKDTQLIEEAKQFIVAEIPSMKMTVDKLKTICKEKGLKVTGKKQDLIDRLEHPDNPEHIAKGKGGKKKGPSSRDVMLLRSLLNCRARYHSWLSGRIVRDTMFILTLVLCLIQTHSRPLENGSMAISNG